MVLTKAEQLQLSELKENYGELKGLIEKVGANVLDMSTKLEQMNNNLTKKIEDVDKKIDDVTATLTNKIDNLQQADEQLSNLVDKHIAESGVRLNNLDTAVKGSHVQIAGMKDELVAANDMINIQAARIVSLEKQCHRGLQHGRGWNIEVDGIPKEVGDDVFDLRKAMTSIFETFNMEVEDHDIEAIHRLPSRTSPKPVIIRFFSRDSVKEIHQKKNRLKDLNERHEELEMAGLTEESKIFFRPSQCTYYKNLSYNCRVLKRKNLISKVNVAGDGRITITLLDNTFVKVSHESDLLKRFPNFKEFSFSYDEKE